MRGYTLDQLTKKHANIANYVGCLNCRLHWHRRSFEKHLNVVPQRGRAAKHRSIAIIHPVWERFLDYLAETAVEHAMKEHAEKIRAGEPLEEAPATPREAVPLESETETITVEEAVARFGLSREEILAEFERSMVPFELTLTTPSRRPEERR